MAVLYLFNSSKITSEKNVEVEFPDKLDDTDFPSWAFSSPGLGFPTSVSASSSSFAAANPMQ
ncbi:hypothetical protein RO3G_01325 [Rhizopus delemar RA 99-880]|uniref:Uncharacterized protein n=1 Tax=Rhizopus delemar (strain RA 99-880 / ATCC MYA-4621 / FGSC 9543 / NRRL 43880) TaxID=246409 RepID=I1BK91_RHIO9|nr:hypothetical protein RO3G_01325 [Rhizopus delemar RA 99-880]|eukprot:EIE76621.1 hypothetical protein RO3G_01325 [Rhizopus delemar RA 99-880]